MRFLLDMGVHLGVVSWLREEGHDVTHLRDEGLHRLADLGVFGKESKRTSSSHPDLRRASECFGASRHVQGELCLGNRFQTILPLRQIDDQRSAPPAHLPTATKVRARNASPVPLDPLDPRAPAAATGSGHPKWNTLALRRETYAVQNDPSGAFFPTRRRDSFGCSRCDCIASRRAAGQ